MSFENSLKEGEKKLNQRIDEKTFKIFYSWQTDLPNKTNRSLIEDALRKACNAIRKDPAIEIEPVIDRDTLATPGSPDISYTILQKIDQAGAFVCDVSIISNEKSFPVKEGTEQKVPRVTPNPNVLFELGYAVKTLGWNRIIMVCNTNYGRVETLPFDLRQRRVLTYSMDEESQPASARLMVQQVFEDAIRSILKLPKLTSDVDENFAVEKEKLLPHRDLMRLLEALFRHFPQDYSIKEIENNVFIYGEVLKSYIHLLLSMKIIDETQQIGEYRYKITDRGRQFLRSIGYKF